MLFPEESLICVSMSIGIRMEAMVADRSFMPTILKQSVGMSPKKDGRELSPVPMAQRMNITSPMANPFLPWQMVSWWILKMA
jgi:hypothetical protein